MAELIQIYIRVELSSCFSMVIVNCEVTKNEPVRSPLQAVAAMAG